MKVVFPCNGSIILRKTDMKTLERFYKAKLLTSEVKEHFENSRIMVEVENFDYIPTSYSLSLNDINFLSIKKLREILELPPVEFDEDGKDHSEDPIEEETIENHPFFKTLKPKD